MKYFENSPPEGYKDRINSIQFVKFIASMNQRNKNNTIELPNNVANVF